MAEPAVCTATSHEVAPPGLAQLKLAEVCVIPEAANVVGGGQLTV